MPYAVQAAIIPSHIDIPYPSHSVEHLPAQPPYANGYHTPILAPALLHLPQHYETRGTSPHSPLPSLQARCETLRHCAALSPALALAFRIA